MWIHNPTKITEQKLSKKQQHLGRTFIKLYFGKNSNNGMNALLMLLIPRKFVNMS